jgi:hypothetical protein
MKMKMIFGPQNDATNPNLPQNLKPSTGGPPKIRGIISGKDLITTYEVPQNGHRFGRWTFDRERLVLVHDNGHEFDLERVTTTNSLTYELFRLAGRSSILFTDEDLGQLVRAIESRWGP